MVTRILCVKNLTVLCTCNIHSHPSIFYTFYISASVTFVRLRSMQVKYISFQLADVAFVLTDVVEVEFKEHK